MRCWCAAVGGAGPHIPASVCAVRAARFGTQRALALRPVAPDPNTQHRRAALSRLTLSLSAETPLSHLSSALPCFLAPQ
eukprot:4309559-Prymnesium_polylepis.1